MIKKFLLKEIINYLLLDTFYLYDLDYYYEIDNFSRLNITAISKHKGKITQKTITFPDISWVKLLIYYHDYKNRIKEYLIDKI